MPTRPHTQRRHGSPCAWWLLAFVTGLVADLAFLTSCTDLF